VDRLGDVPRDGCASHGDAVSLAEAKAKWRAKNEQMQKAIPVEIDQVGTVYVRPLSVADANYISSLKDADGAGYGIMMAGLLCDETGERLPDDEREEWVEIFSNASWDDYLLLSGKARGVSKETTEGN
jgi:hypothetical protein